MAQSTVTRDTQTSQGTAASSGGTFNADYVIPTDKTVMMRVYCIVSAASASHQASSAALYAEYVVENKNGTVTALAALGSSVNPGNSNTATFVAAHAQGSDYGASGTVTLTMSVSGLNARATYTNVGNAVSVNVTIVFDVIIVGST